jgi:hypothetical protein
MPKGVTDDGETNVKELKLEGVEFILRENERLKKRLRGFEGRSAAQKRAEVPNLPAEPQTKPEDALSPKHFVRSWEKTCPDCGEANPEFVNETKCGSRDGGGCGRPLGSIKEASKIKACPDCGFTKFVPLRALTEEEKVLFAK